MKTPNSTYSRSFLLFSARPRLSSSEGSYVKILAADANGNVCAVGSRNGEFLTVKYSPSGAKLWEKTYTGLAGGVSLASDVAAPVASGSVYVVGVSSADGGGKEYVTIKYTHSGQRAWVRRLSPGAEVTTYYEPMSLRAVPRSTPALRLASEVATTESRPSPTTLTMARVSTAWRAG